AASAWISAWKGILAGHWPTYCGVSAFRLEATTARFLVRLPGGLGGAGCWAWMALPMPPTAPALQTTVSWCCRVRVFHSRPPPLGRAHEATADRVSGLTMVLSCASTCCSEAPWDRRCCTHCWQIATGLSE